MQTRNKKRTLGLGVAMGLAASLGFSACGGEEGPEGDQCLSDQDFFQEQVYTAVLANNCANCHTESGDAGETSFIIRGPEAGPDYIEQNLEMFKQLAKLEYDGTPWVLLKPTMQIEHEGGVRFEVDSAEYNAFVEMIDRIDNPTTCDDGEDPVEEYFAGLEMLDEVGTLRKATLSLVGRLPTPAEEQAVREGSWESFDKVMDQILAEDAFYDRLIEIYNDKMLLDRYYHDFNGNSAIGLFGDCDSDPENQQPNENYPNLCWYENDSNFDEIEEKVSKSLAREALQLIAHIVRNDKPYTEVLTANYTVANWYSANSYGVATGLTPEEYDKWVEIQVPGLPHAGVMTNKVFGIRFPTTETNRNRHRVRMVYEFFLGTDVQALGSRPVDGTEIEGQNPTLFNAACNVCHATIDPVAGVFQNWDDQGEYNPREEGWYPEMPPAGFNNETMPSERLPAALQWLGGEMTQDGRFALSAVQIWYKGLTQQDPLKDPEDPAAEDYLTDVEAVTIQRKVFDEISQSFIDSDHNLKVLIKELVKTPYYRAVNASDEVKKADLAKWKDVGSASYMTPEMFDRKIIATLGYPYTNGFDGTSKFLDFNDLRLFSGGIDSNDVTARITAPNGIMANINKRMANEMACLAVSQDFTKLATDRTLFKHVERNFEPEDDNGFEVPAAAAAIRANIQYLALRLWGVYLELNDEEIDRIYTLFVESWKDGNAGMQISFEEGGYSTSVPGVCVADVDYWTGEPIPEEMVVNDDSNYTVRAWMAVVAYMLSDWKFVNE